MEHTDIMDQPAQPTPQPLQITHTIPYGLDDEMTAMYAAKEILDPLDAAARARVLRYLCERFSVPTGCAHQTPSAG